MNFPDHAYYTSPMGILEILGTSKGISSVQFVETIGSSEIPESLKKCFEQLDEYFQGSRKVFSLQLDMQGTEFQKRVWKELLNIPFGKTISYFDVAKNIGDSKASRAIGNANGLNKILIIIPCHRVIGKNGALSGYAAGVHNKQWLMEFENQVNSVSIKLGNIQKPG